MSECPSRFYLVRMCAAELPADERSRLESHLNVCASCRNIVDAIASNAAAYESNAESHMSKLKLALQTAPDDGCEVLPFAARHDRSRWHWAKALVPLAAAAALAIVFVPRWRESAHEEVPAAGERAILFKGVDVAFHVVAMRDGRQFQVEPGAVLIPGDALRFIVDTTSGGYLSVFSVDSQKRISPFYPDTDPTISAEPLRLRGAGRHELPGSIVLDDVTGTEYYVVVFSPQRFDRRDVHLKVARERLEPDFSLRFGSEILVRALGVEKGSR